MTEPYWLARRESCDAWHKGHCPRGQAGLDKSEACCLGSCEALFRLQHALNELRAAKRAWAPAYVRRNSI
jgi:hypothetical protein